MSQILKPSDFYHHPTLPQINHLQGNSRTTVTPVIKSGLLCAISSAFHGVVVGSSVEWYPVSSAGVVASAVLFLYWKDTVGERDAGDNSAPFKWPECPFNFYIGPFKNNV